MKINCKNLLLLVETKNINKNKQEISITYKCMKCKKNNDKFSFHLSILLDKKTDETSFLCIDSFGNIQKTTLPVDNNIKVKKEKNIEEVLGKLLETVKSSKKMDSASSAE